jgi:hypothetical protein
MAGLPLDGPRAKGVSKCKRCGNPRHYAKTCGRRMWAEILRKARALGVDEATIAEWAIERETLRARNPGRA